MVRYAITLRIIAYICSYCKPFLHCEKNNSNLYYKKHYKMAHWLQGSSLLFMVIAIIVLCCMFYGQIENITWAKFFFKLSIGLILLLPSFFLANEAKKQRDKENHYRELEIKLATITPYFLEIQSPEKEQVKLDLAKTLLSPNKNITDNNAVLSSDVLEILKTLTDIIKKK